MFIYIHKIRFGLILLVFIFSFNSVICANDGIPTSKVTVPRTSINIGEPLVAELEYHFKEPQIEHHFGESQTSDKNVIMKEIEAEAYLRIDKEDVTIYQDRLPYLFNLSLQDEKGLDYKGTFVIWYNVLGKKVFFDKPGEYKVGVGLSKESDPIKITVKSENKKAMEALAVFKEVDDYIFLFVGVNASREKRAGLLERLKQVQKQSEGTMLEKWSAARLGVELFKDIQYIKERDPNQIDEIQKYLNKGIELPDDFPVREEALYDLGSIESLKGNKEKTDSLRKELLKKYLKGTFTQRYIEIRDRNKEIQKDFSIVK